MIPEIHLKKYCQFKIVAKYVPVFRNVQDLSITLNENGVKRKLKVHIPSKDSN